MARGALRIMACGGIEEIAGGADAMEWRAEDSLAQDGLAQDGLAQDGPRPWMEDWRRLGGVRDDAAWVAGGW